MADYVQSALLVFDEGYETVRTAAEGNPHGVQVTPLALVDYRSDPVGSLAGHGHVVVAAGVPAVKEILERARHHGFSVGLLPGKSQKALRDGYGLPEDIHAQVEVALRDDPQPVGLVLVNGVIVLLNATLGRLPILESSHKGTGIPQALRALWRLFGLRLNAMTLQTNTGKRIDTAACGCMIVQPRGDSPASRLVGRDRLFTDGTVSLVVAAPTAIVDYLRFLSQFLAKTLKGSNLPSTLGCVHSTSIDITTEPPQKALIDGLEQVSTPLRCEALPGAVRLNIGPALRKGTSAQPAEERVDVKHLPVGKEVARARGKHIPFFGYASEERFRDLFVALRKDSATDSTYVILMLLSTLIATVGLFLSSASVVIGAMLLAPLMAPIMSLAMGITRQDDRLSIRSLKKILVGILIALTTAAMFSMLITHQPVTAEMEARLNPTLLDLAVAIVAGIAGAYTKSYREILQSLAGVAIAVALVPPLAVAGIGLGRGDILFFYHAFLLFSTNLIGITVAATLTFRFLGYSSAVQNRRGLSLVVLLLVLVSVPLYLSYSHIAQTQRIERSWQKERFVVGGKYLIVESAIIHTLRGRDVLYVDILAREPLNRRDLATFKQKIQRYFGRDMLVRAKVTYIL